MVTRLKTISATAILSLMFAFLLGAWQPAGATVHASANAQMNSAVIPGSYIVVFKDGVTNPHAVANEMARTHGLALDQTYDTALKGFAAVIPAARLDRIKRDPRVQFISEDREVGSTGAVAAKPAPNPAPNPSPQPNQIIPNGISRIEVNNTNKGTQIGVAVIDSGIDLTHPDLAGNIVANYTTVKGTRSGNDDNGHGSHVAGTIAAIDNTIGVVGAAPEAKLIAVKVLNKNGSGTTSTVIAGIDWVTRNASTYSIKVANMSLSAPGASDDNCGNTNNDAMHKAICASTAAGITYVVAAGNDGASASNFIPASYNDTVITVSALADSDGGSGGLGQPTSYSYPDDTFAGFSNYGSVVDLGAPGVDIYSTFKNGGYYTSSGTSMATPHATGAAALYLKSHPGSSWQQVRDGLASAGELLNFGHTDPSGLYPEPVVLAGLL